MSKLPRWTRRRFLKSTAIGAGGVGLATALYPHAILSRNNEINYNFDKLFPRYEEYGPIVPVWNATPDIDRCIHRFHLSSPFSPSGKYLGLTRLAREDRPPKPGEVAEIVLVDLHTGEQNIIAETKGWDTQLGAQVQWGASDAELFYNDMDTETWIPYGVKMNPITGERIKLGGTVYDISPDGRWAVSTDLRKIGHTQAGYGVKIPEQYIQYNDGAPDNDGVYVTDTSSGNSELIASYKKIVEQARPKIDVSRYGVGAFYGFHTKWNKQSNRIMLVLRHLPDGSSTYKPMLLTMSRQGEDIQVAIPASEWADKGGNHPNWHPDGEHVIMNLNIEEKGWEFVQARYDGIGLKKIVDVPANHGHISLHPSGKFILNDAYPHGDQAYFDTTAPLWLVDVNKRWKYTIARFESVTRFFAENRKAAGAMRVDPHPAWDSHTHTHVAFNAVNNGTRHVYIADLSNFINFLLE